jgi:hypothetical protein
MSIASKEIWAGGCSQRDRMACHLILRLGEGRGAGRPLQRTAGASISRKIIKLWGETRGSWLSSAETVCWPRPLPQQVARAIPASSKVNGRLPSRASHIMNMWRRRGVPLGPLAARKRGTACCPQRRWGGQHAQQARPLRAAAPAARAAPPVDPGSNVDRRQAPRLTMGQI